MTNFKYLTLLGARPNFILAILGMALALPIAGAVESSLLVEIKRDLRNLEVRLESAMASRDFSSEDYLATLKSIGGHYAGERWASHHRRLSFRMIRSLLVALPLPVVLLSCGQQQADTGDKLPALDSGLRVTTWNLQWFPGMSPGQVSVAEQELHTASVANVLRDLDPDILCVQEIKDPQALVKLASAMPGHSVQVVSAFKGTQEVAILSRHQAEISFAQEFAKAPATPPRGFAHAAFRFGDQVLAVYTVHLKANNGGIDATAPKREESARQLVAHVAEITRVYAEDGLPCTTLLCGDFNYDPGQDDWGRDDTFRILLDAGFIWVGRGQPRAETVTWLSEERYPDAAFDHLLVRPAQGVTVGAAVAEKTAPVASWHLRVARRHSTTSSGRRCRA